MSLRAGLAASAVLHLALAAALAGLEGRAVPAPGEVAVALVFTASDTLAGSELAVAAAPPVPAVPPPPPAIPPVAAVPAPAAPARPPLPAPPPPADAVPAAHPPRPPALPPRAAARPAPPPAGAVAGPPGAAVTGPDAAEPAAVRHRVEPRVPEEARRQRWQGTVLLAVTVSPEGTPAEVLVLRSSGHPALDRAAAEALWQWRFHPARRGGVAVAERLAVPITFRILD